MTPYLIPKSVVGSQLSTPLNESLNECIEDEVGKQNFLILSPSSSFHAVSATAASRSVLGVPGIGNAAAKTIFQAKYLRSRGFPLLHLHAHFLDSLFSIEILRKCASSIRTEATQLIGSGREASELEIFPCTLLPCEAKTPRESRHRRRSECERSLEIRQETCSKCVSRFDEEHSAGLLLG